MNILLLALVVGVIMACGTYLVLRRSPIRLILGLALLSHAVNLLLFSASSPLGGTPPIIADKEAFDGNVAGMADPLPQALILTAIVISFGVTAFIVVLINRRNALSQPAEETSDVVPSRQVIDPFAPTEYYASGLVQEADDYQWLEYPVSKKCRKKTTNRPQGSAADVTDTQHSINASSDDASSDKVYNDERVPE